MWVVCERAWVGLCAWVGAGVRGVSRSRVCVLGVCVKDVYSFVCVYMGVACACVCVDYPSRVVMIAGFSAASDSIHVELYMYSCVFDAYIRCICVWDCSGRRR